MPPALLVCPIRPPCTPQTNCCNTTHFFSRAQEALDITLHAATALRNPRAKLKHIGPFSAADVARHSSEDDAWIIVDGKVRRKQFVRAAAPRNDFVARSVDECLPRILREMLAPPNRMTVHAADRLRFVFLSAPGFRTMARVQSVVKLAESVTTGHTCSCIATPTKSYAARLACRLDCGQRSAL